MSFTVRKNQKYGKVVRALEVHTILLHGQSICIQKKKELDKFFANHYLDDPDYWAYHNGEGHALIDQGERN